MAAALLLRTASLLAVPVSYTANLNTYQGNPVTNIMILETDGTQSFLDYTFTLPGTGISVLTHDTPFQPTKSLVIGLTQGVDDTEIVMFLNGAFAQANLGNKFSVAFPNTRHSELIARLTSAEAGNATEIDWFRDTFFPGDGAAAAFNTGGPFTVAEFTSLGIVGASATAGNWNVNSVENILQGAIGSELGLGTSRIGETAGDPGPFDIEFQLTETGTVAIDKSVLNDTGLGWSAFELLLGTGLGDQFVPSTAGDGLGFNLNLPNGEGTGAFPGLLTEEDRLLFSGSLPNGGTAEFLAFVNSSARLSFTIRQTPTLVPEPGSSALAWIGLTILWSATRRKRGDEIDGMK